MRKLMAGVVALVVVLACAREEGRKTKKVHYASVARMAGMGAPRQLTRGTDPPEDRDVFPASESALREAAVDGDAVDLSDLAAELVKQGYTDSRKAVEAITIAQRAIAKDPELAAAHFNLALALERVGLAPEARAELEEAARLEPDDAWAAEARRRADELRLSDREIDRDAIRRYVSASSDPAAREVLRPYLAARVSERPRAVRDATARLQRAADISKYEMDVLLRGAGRALHALAADKNAHPYAIRYYLVGALHAVGREAEAAWWLGSIDGDVRQHTGEPGLAAQLVWEEGLHMIVRGSGESAAQLFETARDRNAAAGEGDLADLFDGLARDTRASLLNRALLARDVATAYRHAENATSLEKVQAALASDAAILRYSTSMQHTVAFVVRRDSVEVVTLVTTPDIAQAAERMRRVEDREFGALAALLHDLLFAPLAAKLEGVSTIAVVPNRDLRGIPFGALFDAQRGEYLAQRFTIVHASSASAAIEASKRAREVRDPTLLAIGATEFEDPRAELLPQVDREVADIAASSRCARVFSGSQATAEAVQRELAENAIVHYAGHIVRRGADWRLLLAGRELPAKEIAAFQLQKPRVVVLAACRGAAIADPYATIPTMSDAFLAAGVPTVIASSYDLEDSEAPPTMRRLHAFLQRGDDAAEALRKTTIEELRAGRGVPVSIRFQAIGGASSLVR